MSGYTPDSPEFRAWIAEQERLSATPVPPSDPDSYLRMLNGGDETIIVDDPGGALGPDDTPKTIKEFKQQRGKTGGGNPKRRPDGGGARSLAEIARARTEALFNIKFEIPELPDPETGEPFVATIQQPDMMMLMSAGAVPGHLRRQVNEFLKTKGETIRGDDGDFDESKLLQEVEDDLLGAASEVMTIADIICVNSFVEPKLVWTQIEEARDPVNCLWFERIPRSARQRLWTLMKGQQEAGQRAVAAFPVDSGEVVRSNDPIEVPEP